MKEITLLKVIQFAVIAHGKQERKYTGEPYITHPIEVAALVLRLFKDEKNCEVMVCAAICHDVLEDTDESLFKLEKILGEKFDLFTKYVLGLSDVSKPHDGNRKIRKQIDRIHLHKQCREVQLIKLCDLMDNTKSIVKFDPNFAKIYLKEKNLILDGMLESVKKHPLFEKVQLNLS